jgi:hypothetical protein
MLDFTLLSPDQEEFFDKGKFPLNPELISDNRLYCNCSTLNPQVAQTRPGEQY